MRIFLTLIVLMVLLAACTPNAAPVPAPTEAAVVLEVTATQAPATATTPPTETPVPEPTTTPRPSRTPSPIPALSSTANRGSTSPMITRDGRYIVFESTADDLSPNTPVTFCTSELDGGARLPCQNIYKYDRETDELTLVSIKFNNLPADGNSYLPVISDHGRYVAYMSYASNLETEEIRCESNETWYICPNIFVYDSTTRRTLWVSRPVDAPRPVNNGNQTPASLTPGISGDGSLIVYMSRAENIVEGDTNGFSDIFVFEQGSGTTRRISVSSSGEQANAPSSRPVISGNGRVVVFASLADNLVPNDTNNTVDVFAHDLETGETTRISVASDGTEADLFSEMPTISYDGQYVVFESVATTLNSNDQNYTCDLNGDNDPSENCRDIFLHDRESGTTTVISLSANGAQNLDSSLSGQISGDGNSVLFSNLSSGLVPQDGNDSYDLFLRDLTDNTTTRVSVSSDGVEGDHQSGITANPFALRPNYSLSSDGRYIVFGSSSTNFVENDLNDGESCDLETIEGNFAPECSDIFLYDRETGELTLISYPRKNR